MIIESIKSDITEEQLKDLQIDYVDINWYETKKRIHRLTTRKGAEIGIKLNDDDSKRGLRQGDVLVVREGKAIVVNIKECDCIVVEAKDKKTIAKVCYEVGNRHAPLFYGENDEQFVMLYDKPTFEMLKKLGVNPVKKSVKICNEKSISSDVSNEGHHH